MIVLSPNTTDHTLKIIPRYYAEGNVFLELWNEETKETLQYTIEMVSLDGYSYLNFEQEFIDKTNYQIKLTQDDEVVYRGKLFITSQANETQSYQITKDVFTYE